MQFQFTHDTVRWMGLQVLAVYVLLQVAEKEGQVPTTHQWIWEHMPDKTGINSVTAALRWLTSPERQLAVRVSGGWRLTGNAFQLPLGYELKDESQIKQIHSQSENHSQSESAPLLTSIIKSKDLNLKKTDLTILINTDENHSQSENHSGSDSEIVYQVSEITGKLILLPEEEVQERVKVCYENKIYARKAREIAEDVHIDVDDIRPHVLWAIHEQEVNPPMDDRKKQNPTGMAIYRLLNHVPAPVLGDNGRFDGCGCWKCKLAISPDAYFGHHTATDDDDNAETESTRMVQDDSVNERINGKITADEVWQTVLEQLQMDMPKASFDTWVRDTQAISYHEGVIKVGTRNSYARDWLENRLKSTVERIIVGFVSQSLTVEFVVKESEAEP
jgi:hypothetical protein